ncbi:MAG: prepilin peptidase [Acidimicrobiales bacterium]
MSTASSLRGVDSPARLAATVVVGAGVEAALAWRFGWSVALPAYLVFGAVATAVSATDLAARRVPDRVTAPALLGGAVLLAVASAHSGKWWPLGRAGIAMAVLGCFYLALGLVSKGGMGMGDVKWAGVVGLYCGWLGWPAPLDATLLAFAAAALVVIARRACAPNGDRRVLPMAPFMAAGALLAVLLAR